jgi:hypothetical protein
MERLQSSGEQSNVCCVLFVLALVYLCLLALMFFRTCGPVCKRGKPDYPLTYTEKTFKLFYILLWIVVILLNVNYWYSSISLYQHEKAGNSGFLSLFVFLYIPPCFLVVSYGVLYY